jgi:carboxymethylenebutenolidase
MCYDDKAVPPTPPGAAGATHTEELVLTASDGNTFAVFLAKPAQPSKAQIVIYPDVRGLHQFYKELATRFAEVGVTAIAFDYFGRSAGLTSRAEPFEYMPHVQQLKLDTLFMDVQATLDYLRQNVANNPTFVVGFCMGGALTLMSGTNPAFKYAGLIPFYAGMTRDFGGRGTVLDNADKILYPVTGFFGGADQGIPEEKVRELEAKLKGAGIETQLTIYEGAPHSFFDRRATEFAEASADAWKRLLEFIKLRSEPTPTA